MFSQNNADNGGDISGCDSAEDEEQDDPSSSQQEIEDVLASFREKWHKELRVSPKHHQQLVKHATTNEKEDEDFEIEAKNLFMKGVEMEKSGKLYEAIQFYRRAVQLVPDIEFRIDYIYKNKSRDIQSDEHDLDIVELHEVVNTSSDDESEEITEENFIHHIQKKVNKSPFFCLPAVDQTNTHISALPMEILLYIFKWVVSSDLDLRSLEICSHASRGFYLCARDSEIWKLACMRAWGLHCGSLGYYSSWRQMFIERPRLHFHGCYISKTTYIRHGENSFQDQFYRPWHLIAYYRYLRFFPEGLVLMLTTPDEPILCVSQLKSRNFKSPSVLSGHYRLKEDKLTIVVHRQENTKSNPYNKRNRRKDTIYDAKSEQTFHLELRIENNNKKRHVQLIWTGYSVLTTFGNGRETETSFDIVANRFPPLWFSRVKSYTSESFSPLQ